MSKLWALFNAFRKGSALTDPDLWRNRAGAANAVVGALAAIVALAAVFGHKLEVNNDDLQAIALGVVAIALGLALHRRSQGKEAKFGTARAEHDPDETPDDSVDVASLDALFVLCALLMILVAALLPALK